jgi:hypothetical protein
VEPGAVSYPAKGGEGKKWKHPAARDSGNESREPQKTTTSRYCLKIRHNKSKTVPGAGKIPL